MSTRPIYAVVQGKLFVYKPTPAIYTVANCEDKPKNCTACPHFLDCMGGEVPAEEKR